MSLRLRLLISLFLLALLPLIIAAVINLPLVLERVDLFYRAAFLQNLRADFSDLDQHLASRDSSVRLLARLPEPGVLTGTAKAMTQPEIDQSRARYIMWINRILGQERDITRIVFMDQEGHPVFWLDRDRGNGHWIPTTEPPAVMSPEHLRMVLDGDPNKVTLSPVQIERDTGDRSRAVTLQLMAPVMATDGNGVQGMVAITIDISGLVQRDPNTFWVRNDGRYLSQVPDAQGNTSAFDRFAGLAQQFARPEVAIWEGDDRRVIWVPMFRTASGEPLWVGRDVDLSPLKQFRSEIVVRVLAIILGLVILLFLVVRVIAKRTEKITSELTGGIHKTLVTNEAVRFAWDDTRELKQLAADLTRLSERHAAHTRSLRAHTRELEASNRYKSEFLANVSHELRTPLNSILLLSKLLAKGDNQLDPEARKQADVIHQASCDLKTLIDDVLDLSRIESGRLQLNCEEVALRPVLEGLRELMLPQFHDRDLDFALDVARDVPDTLFTDVDKVRQVLKNFLGNALKFTRAGRVVLRARLAAAPYTLALSVDDTGIGISVDKQEKIFEAFQQADGSTARKYGGTGLGLTISRQLALMLGGEIRLHSTPGEGSSFTLLLPAQRSAMPVSTPRPVTRTVLPEAADDDLPAAGQDNEAVPAFHGKEALVLDAEVRSQLRLSELLEDLGMVAHIAGDPEEALETLEEVGAIDVLLIDPGASGDDVCATISALRALSGRDMMLVGLVRDATDEGRRMCGEAGLKTLLHKPVDARELTATLEAELPGAGSGSR